MNDRLEMARWKARPDATVACHPAGGYRPVATSPNVAFGQGCSGSRSMATPMTVPTVANGLTAIPTNGSRRLEEFPH